MDNSFQAAMNDLVAADAARMSGRAFADGRGAGLARRVRTRRTVRAAGMGGASAVAVGAVALGAMHMPWGATKVAGVASDDCATASPSDDAYAYEVLVRKVDRPGDTASLTDAATGAAFLTATLQPDGTYVFTDVDGNPLKATAEETPLVNDVDGNPLMSTADELYKGYWVIGPQSPPEDWGTAPPGAAEILVKSVSTTDFVGLPSAVRSALDDCYTPSPTPTQVSAVAAGPSPSPDPRLAAKPEDVTNPFQCGFEFPTDSLSTEGLWIDGTKWMDGASAAAAIRGSFSDPSQAPTIGNLTGSVPVATVHIASTVTDGSSAIAYGTADPSIAGIETELAGDTSDVKGSEGATFVGVTNGRVVATGTVKPDGSTNAPPVYLDLRPYGDGSLLYLLNQGAALTSCDATPVDSSHIDLVAVAGVVVKHADGTVTGPTYAWRPLTAQ